MINVGELQRGESATLNFNETSWEPLTPGPHRITVDIGSNQRVEYGFEVSG